MLLECGHYFSFAPTVQFLKITEWIHHRIGDVTPHSASDIGEINIVILTPEMRGSKRFRSSPLRMKIWMLPGLNHWGPKSMPI